jgi:thiamine kinase-like enzyme
MDARTLTRTASAEPERHPAVRAWQALGSSESIARAELLCESKKTAAFRLARPGEQPVIAKWQAIDVVARERAVYTRILPTVRMDRLSYLGSLTKEGDPMGWTFLEDAGEHEFSFSRPEHRRLAATWLARLHSQSAVLAAASVPSLYRPSVADYLERLRAAKDRIAAWGSRLDKSVLALARVVAAWELVERAWCAQPAAFVHGDFQEKNIRIGEGAGGGELIVLDWDMAAIAVPAVDLFWMVWFPDALEQYRCALGRARVDESDAVRAARLGAVLRAVDVLDWNVWDPELWRDAKDRVNDLVTAFSALEDDE